jgi:hypothetical protein
METMIFLAVSGVIFVSVALLISGQLNNTQTKDSINNIESVVRGVLNDVSNGYYPEVGTNFTCTTAFGSPPTVGNVGGTDRGTHMNCLLIGKKITFNKDNLLIDTAVASSASTTIDANLFAHPIDLRETKDYKWGLQHKGALSQIFYVLNTSFGAGAFVTGAQAVKIYDGNTSPITLLTNPRDVCFTRDDGAKYLKLIIGKGGALTVDSDYTGNGC